MLLIGDELPFDGSVNLSSDSLAADGFVVDRLNLVEIVASLIVDDEISFASRSHFESPPLPSPIHADSQDFATMDAVAVRSIHAHSNHP